MLLTPAAALQVLGKLSDQQRSLLEERFKAAERQAASQGLDIGYRRLERAGGAGNGYAQDGGYPQDNGYAPNAGYAAAAAIGCDVAPPVGVLEAPYTRYAVRGPSGRCGAARFNAKARVDMHANPEQCRQPAGMQRRWPSTAIRRMRRQASCCRPPAQSRISPSMAQGASGIQ